MPTHITDIPCADLACFPRFTVPAGCFRVSNPRASVILLPAMGTSARFYSPFAESLAGCGFSVLLPELPGTGASQPRPSWTADYGYRDLVETWLPGLIESARKMEENVPIIVIGHSLGAQVGSLAVGQGLVEVDALVTIAGGHIHYRNWDGVSAGKVLFAAALFPSLTYLFGHMPGQYFGFGGAQARTLIREWSRVIIRGNFSHVAKDLTVSTRIPSLCIGLEGDELAPPRSVMALAAILDSESLILPVNWPGNPHSSWAKNPESTIEVINHWVSQRDIA